MTHVENTGEIFSQNGDILFKMWHAVVDPARREFRRHCHTRFEITLVASGSGIYSTPAGVFPMQPGDVFVFSGNEWHCITEIHDSGMEIINLHFEPRYLMGNSHDSLSVRHADFCFAHSADFKNRIPAADAADLAGRILEMEKELREQPEEYALCIKSHLNLLLISLIREHGYCTESSVHSMGKLLNGLAYIDNHFTESLTLEEIAAAAGMAPTYFSALFKKLCNIPLWHYISTRRIEKAARMILDDNFDGTMLEVALSCGFNNTANFNKAFRKCTGMTPSAYKQSGDVLLH